ncbi:MAG: mechanosensitive ion channel family protein [Breznakia sp.]
MLVTSTTPPFLSEYFEGGLAGSLIFMGILLLIFYIIYVLIQRLIQRKKIGSAKSLLNIIRAIFFIILFLCALSRITIFKGATSTIFASSGIIAIVAGLAAQDTLGNLLSGIMIISFKPFVVGDLIKVNGEQLIGFVEEITLRHTIIQTYENNRIIVPNNEMNKATIENANLVDSVKGNYFSIPVSYRSDLDKAVEIIKNEVKKHPHFLDARSKQEIAEGEDAVIVNCIAYGENSIMLRCVIHSTDSLQGFQMLSDLRFSIKKHFDRDGIEMPYNHLFDPPK